MKHWLALLIALWLAACFHQEPTPKTAESQDQSALVKPPVAVETEKPAVTLRRAIEAYQRKLSDLQVEDTGTVVKLLPDDTRGLKHQKFLVKVDGIALLFAHNIDLAPRVEDLKVGDTVSFRGEYVYNPKGGIMHWTHHDPRNQHAPGWIKHNGKTYE
jgi:hypothetical protein